VAALSIGGQTYYRFAGWDRNSRKRSVSQLEREARYQHERWKRLNEADVLIIDEISMVDAHQVDRLDRICRAARRVPTQQERKQEDFVENHEDWERYHSEEARSPHASTLPFGGIQIVVTGDFCQLPPIAPFDTCFPCGKMTDDLGRGIWRCEYCDNTFRSGDEWAFQSHAWQDCDFINVQLTEVHRQTDADFVAILEEVRAGRSPSESQLRLLLNHPCEAISAIKLFPRKAEAAAENAERLKEIPLHAIKYACSDNVLDERPIDVARLPIATTSSLHEKLALKKGMLVMNLVNGSRESGIVNGSQGEILDFYPYGPNKLHQDAEVDANRLPAARGNHAAHRDALTRMWMQQAPVKLLPFVQFFSGQRAVIFPVCDVEEVGDETPYTLSSRTQLPLAPAWAISVHKSQGMTLDRVFINLDRSFKNEMPYVALSRARSLHGLELRSSNGLAALRDVRRNPVVQYPGQLFRSAQGRGSGGTKPLWHPPCAISALTTHAPACR
jgi:ATP-dependent DNA helicase PIF1